MSAMAPAQPADRNGFTVAILSALQLESDAVEALFDKFWDDEPHFGKAEGDPNSYTLGCIGPHNVVLAYLPGIGKVNSAGAAASFRVSFPRIRLGLVVGICGGVPRSSVYGKDIFLGDVIVSTRVVQIDLGRQYPDKFVRKDTLPDDLGGLSQELRSFLNKMQGWRARTGLQKQIAGYVSQVCDIEGFENSAYPGTNEDELYEGTYRHKHQLASTCAVCAQCNSMQDPVCEVALTSSCTQTKCDKGKLVIRPRMNSDLQVHFGSMASGDAVMKSAQHREQIAEQEEIIGFEMEGAGVWNSFPTIVVKGVCDYADSHKNKKWQNHAAAVAAATTKALLQKWGGVDMAHAAPAQPSAVNSTAAPRYQVEGDVSQGTVFKNHGTVGNQTNEQHVMGNLIFDMTQPTNVFSGNFKSGQNMYAGNTFDSEGKYR